MTMVQINDLSFAYNGSAVLEGLSLSICKGERVAILGPNGAGKTTLLKLIGGTLHPARGSVSISGTLLERFPRRELACQVATVPQVFTVPFAFSVREIVELGRTPYLRPLAALSLDDRQAVSRALELTGTVGLADRIFNELSGGECQRVVIAMALAQEPEILLLDEPTQQLDLARQAAMLDLIFELNRSKGLTVIAAIHDLNLAATYFDRLVVLHNATVVADGTPVEILSVDLLQHVFGTNVDVAHPAGQALPIVLPKSCIAAGHLRQLGGTESRGM